MIAYLNPKLAHLLKVASREESRYGGGTRGVLVAGAADGPYHVVATDGKRMVVVHAEYDDEDYPDLRTIPAFDGEVLVPPEEWKRACDNAARVKLNGRAWPLGVGAHQGEVILTTADSVTLRCKEQDGRFPNWRNVLPKTPPVLALSVDPKLLAEVLLALHQFTADEQRGVRLLFYDFRGTSPFGIVATGEDGLVAEALVVPMVERNPGKPQ